MTTAGVYHEEPGMGAFRLRSYFVLHLVKSPSYDSKVQDVKARWATLVAQHPDLDSVMFFRNLPASENAEDGLNQYIFEVRRVTAEEFRCRTNGAPAAWICQSLHAAARGASVLPELESEEVRWLGEVRFDVSTLGYAGIGATINGTPAGPPQEIESDASGPFREFSELKRELRKEVDRLVDTVEQEQKWATSHWTRKYERGLKTRTEETMPKVIAFLVENKAIYGVDRSTVYDLLKELELDPPGDSTKFDGI